MESSYIKKELYLSDAAENNHNSNNYTLPANSIVAFQIKSELIDNGFTISESFIDNSHRCISIIKEEIDILDDKESDEKIIHNDNLEQNQKYNYCETESTNVQWPSKYKTTSKELKSNCTSGNGISKNQHNNSSIGIVSTKNKSLRSNNMIVLKDVTVDLERMPMSKISEFKKTDSPQNIYENDISRRSSFCNFHCSQCDKTIDATPIYKPTICHTCKTTMSIQCKKCGRSYSNPHTMYSHLIRRCYPRKKFNCAHCNFGTTIRSSFTRHMVYMHNENNQTIECPKCHKTLKHRYAFNQHHRLCKTEGHFSCMICPYKTHRKKKFKNHMASHEKFNKIIQENRSNTNDDNTIGDINSKSTVLKKCEIFKNFKRFCPQCNTTFENSNRFGNKRIAKFMYECHLCKTRVLLQCLKCNIKLNDLSKMKRHLVTKCALKINYKCPECHYETVYKRNLNFHIKRFHTAIDPKEIKKCPKCDKTFKLSRDFNRHLKACGSELYHYNCDHCFFRTKSKNYMQIHAKKHMNTGLVEVKKNCK